MRFVLSTVGTSILTNLINARNNPDEAGWQHLLRDAANLKREELAPETAKAMDSLYDRALDKLLENDAATNRRISAELNGIYGIYDGQLSENSSDEHYLICTDTAQGQTTGELIQAFLQEQGFHVHIYTPRRLSTQDSDAFTTGAKELIRWLEENVPWRRESGYRVIFNLVGGFKSLQGYMNTFGAFYADEVVYIFEAPTADLIRIPRLPIQIDTTVIQEHRTQFALMAAGHLYSMRELEGIPETLLEFDEENGETYASLSTWGELLWSRAKSVIFSEALLPFPRLHYEPTFRRDFNTQRDSKARVQLQETLAKIAYHLQESNGDPTRLGRASGLRFKRLKGHPGLSTFRIARGTRVSCSVERGTLRLRRYGSRDDVNANP